MFNALLIILFSEHAGCVMVWGQARYLLVTEIPHNTESLQVQPEWEEKNHFAS